MLSHVGDLPGVFLEFGEYEYPVGWKGNFHTHHFYQVVYIKSGQPCLQTTYEVSLEPGQFAALPPGLSHNWRNAGEGKMNFINLNFKPDLAGYPDLEKYLQTFCDGKNNPGILPSRLDLLPLTEKIRSEIGVGDYGYKYNLSALMTQLTVAAFRSGLKELLGKKALAGKVPKIEKALWFLESNYAREIHLEDVSRVLNVSNKYACELFSKETGYAPMHYLQKVRIDKACSYLEDPNLRIQEVADLVGIEDAHYFSKLFKKLTGRTPTGYRALLFR